MLNLSQQANYFPRESIRPVTIIGAGAVGSNVATMLARMGATDITVYDGDSIDSHNIAPSAYGSGDFGSAKVEALHAVILRDTEVNITRKCAMYAGERLKGTVIVCVDSMRARKLVWEKVKNNPLVDIVVDTRTAEKFWQVFAIEPCKPADIVHYEHFLAYDDADTAQQTCGLHGIIFVSLAVAAEVGENLANFWACGRKNRHVDRLCGSELLIHQQEN